MKRAIALFALVAAAFHTSAADAVAPVRIRAASYNIRCETTESDSANNWSTRKGELVTLVKSIAPDVIGFQEVRSGQYKYLQDEFQGYTFVGVMRDSSSNSEATPVAFRKERFTLLESGTFWLSATPEVVGSKAWGDGIGESILPRICTWALLKDVASGGVFCFACTHLDHREDKFRLAGMQLILSRLAKFLDSGVPVVLVGDMNALETESSMLAATEKLQDAMLVSKFEPTGPWRTLCGFSWVDEEVACTNALSGYSATERTANTATLGKRIDYIFTTKGVEVESFTIRNDARPGMRYYPSDHYPVAADLVLPCLGEAWLRESAATSGWTGEWSENVNYGEGGRAYLSGDVAFEPTNASTSNVVTVETKAILYACSKDCSPDADAQAAVRISVDGCFQVWTRKELGIESGGVGELGWVDVEAQGVTPISGAEYTLRFSFNYSTGTYSVDLKQNDAWLPLSTSTLNSSTHPLPQSSTSNFLLASSAKCVSSFAFVGDTLFTSLSGTCRMVVLGFAENETVVLKDNAIAILNAAKAAWLNKCAGGDKAAAGSAAANVSSKEFEEAYLLNLDIADGERSYSFAIADVKVGDENVTVSVTLKRAGIAGGEAAPINGTLKFYGASTLEAFKNASSAAIETTNLTAGDFSKSDTATATFPKGANKFFKAKIEE